MSAKLFVGNLSYETTSDEIRDLFSEVGAVESCQVITDRDTGRSKGFGFVEMESGEQAQTAIKAMNGQDNNGRALTVNEARPREDRGGNNRGHGGGGDRRY
jgi:cold-inducible RNA-binding protein